MAGEVHLTRHIATDEPRVMVVDGSKVARRMIEQVLKQHLPNATVLACETGADARRELENGVVDLVTTALTLDDMDGLELARHVRESSPQAYIPIVVVSGSVQERLADRGLSDDVTDYFDKSLGFAALAQFIHGYVAPQTRAEGRVLYVEDSKVVALATRRMLEKYGLSVQHVVSVEDALALIDTARTQKESPADIVLTDVYLKGELSGKELLEQLRGPLGYSRGALPVLVMTADDNPKNQAALLRAGANDLVHKPVEERLLLTKLMFQLRVSQNVRRAAANGAGAAPAA
ncbi:MAG TPA: response regulator [Xanthomonadales bacterium]|nr:response regulator [Xanthomonadales bacterium]